MLYYLERLSEGATSDFLKAFNVFQYITFRSVFAALTAFVLSLLFGNYTIRITHRTDGRGTQGTISRGQTRQNHVAERNGPPLHGG